MAKRITTKRIDQETPLITEVIAEIVAETLLGETYKDDLGRYMAMTDLQKKEFDDKYKEEKAAIEKHLVERANTVYQYNEDFNKLMKSKSNAGRDSLYVYMYHWVGMHEGKIKVPFKEMILKYQTEKSLFKP